MGLRKTVAVAAGAMVAVLSLSGCIRMQADVYVDSSAAIDDVAITIALNKDAMKQLGSMGGGGGESITDLESFKKALQDQSGQQGAADATQDCEYSESSTEFIATCKADTSSGEFKDMVNNLSDQVTLTKEGNKIVGSLQTEAAAAGNDQLSGMMGGMFKVVLAVHFPGKITDFSGAGATVDPNDPNTLLVDQAATDGGVVTVTAEDGSGNVMPMLIAGGVVVLLLIALGVWFAVNRGGSSKSAATPPLLKPSDLDPPTQA